MLLAILGVEVGGSFELIRVEGARGRGRRAGRTKETGVDAVDGKGVCESSKETPSGLRQAAKASAANEAKIKGIFTDFTGTKGSNRAKP